MTKSVGKVGIIGSWRSEELDEGERTYYRKEHFPLICEKIGELLANNNYSLVAAWSNDFLYKQVLNNVYHFEDTADYHTLKGYLKNQSIRPILYLSKLNFEIFKLTKKIYEWKKQIPQEKWILLNNDFKNPTVSSLRLTDSLTDVLSKNDNDLMHKLRRMQVGEYDGLGYISYLIESDIQFISQIVDLNDYNAIDDKLLRSEITLDVFLPEIDLLFTIGGGKVTRVALDYAMNKQLPVISILSFGGETDDFYSEEKLKSSIDQIRDSNIREKVRVSIDKLLKGIEFLDEKETLEKILEELQKKA
jgi:hypothetical protein